MDPASGKAQRQAQLKRDTEDMMPKTAFSSKWRKIGDTNFGQVNMIQLRNRATRESSSGLVKKMIKNGIAQAAAFPPTLPCPELVLECATHYDQHTKTVYYGSGAEKKMLVNLSDRAIQEVFNIPHHRVGIFMTRDQAAKHYNDNTSHYLALLCETWLKEPRKRHSKLPKFSRTDLKEGVLWMTT